MEAGGDAAERAELALRALKENLPARDRLMLEGEEALATGDPNGVTLMEDVVKRYPDDPDAWILLGEQYVHLGDRLNRTLDDTWRAFSTAAELDPTFSPTYIHYAETAMRRGDVDRARELIDTYHSLSVGTHQGLALSLGFALQFGDAASRDAALATLDTLTPHTASDLSNGLGFAPAGLDALQAVASTQWMRSRSPRWAASVLDTYVARGRLERARAFSTEAGDALGSLDRFLLVLADPIDPPVPPSPAACRGEGSCLLLVGVTAVDRGDTRSLTASRAAFAAPLDSARTADNDDWAAWLTMCSDALGAYEAWRVGDPLSAFRTLRGDAALSFCVGRTRGADAPVVGADRGGAGRTADAVQYFASLEQFTPFGCVAMLLQARLHEEVGDTAAAAREYRRFLDLWSDAPEDHPYVR